MSVILLKQLEEFKAEVDELCAGCDVPHIGAYSECAECTTMGKIDELQGEYAPELFDGTFDHPRGVTDICDVCGGELVLMGTLGNLKWFRCRNCSMECSEEYE